MVPNQYMLKWDSYHKEIGSGFAHLQQTEEFVDMTLAAEGHFVKVHRNLIALASPYLKELLCSTPCAHPVLFLYNISHKVLCYLLEYIYTGEVHLPNDMLTPFLEATKALCIMGAKDIVSTQSLSIPTEPQVNNSERSDSFAAHITINRENYNLEVQSLGNNFNEQSQIEKKATIDNNTLSDMPFIILQNGKHVGYDGNEHNVAPADDCNSMDYSVIPNDIDNGSSVSAAVQPTIYSSVTDNGGQFDINADYVGDVFNEKEPVLQEHIHPDDSKIPGEINNHDSLVTAQSQILPNISGEKKFDIVLQYSLSNKGAVQLILNRYIYYCHHQSFGDQKRRWRCIDYRKLHCPAFIDTNGERITSRKGIHNHAYHDGKIFNKSKQKILYSSIPKTAKKLYQNANKKKSKRCSASQMLTKETT